MSSRGFLANLLGSTAAPAPAGPTPAPQANEATPAPAGAQLELSDEQRQQLNADVQAERTAAHAAGFAACRTRFAAVMSSDKGKKNPSAAVKFLGSARLDHLTAEEIVDLIDEPAAAAPAAAAPTGAEASRQTAQQQLEATPSVALGNGEAAAAADAGRQDAAAKPGSDEAASVWGGVQSKASNALTAGGSAWGRAQGQGGQQPLAN